MRIRTDGEFSYRQDTIQEAADAWGCNKMRAVLLSCELAEQVLTALPALLEDDRLPPEVAAGIVEALGDTRHLETSYRSSTVTIDPEN